MIRAVYLVLEILFDNLYSIGLCAYYYITISVTLQCNYEKLL